MTDIQKQEKCKRCGYEWPRRSVLPPKACPACKSYRWNVPLRTKKPKAAK